MEITVNDERFLESLYLCEKNLKAQRKVIYCTLKQMYTFERLDKELTFVIKAKDVLR